MRGDSLQESADRIASRLEDYNWAIKKHGVKTLTGSLSSILDLKSVSAIATGTGIASIVGGPIWGALAAGSLAISKISVWLIERYIELEDIKRGPGSEVALIYDMKKRFRKHRRTEPGNAGD